MNVEIFDKLIAATAKIGVIAVLGDMVREMNATDRKRCGNCYYWMMSRECPRERNVNGRNVGPSSGELACQKFELTGRAKDLKESRRLACIKFAEESGLTPTR